MVVNFTDRGFSRNHWTVTKPSTVEPAPPLKLMTVVGSLVQGCIRRRKVQTGVSEHEWLCIIICTTDMLVAAPVKLSNASSNASAWTRSSHLQVPPACSSKNLQEVVKEILSQYLTVKTVDSIAHPLASNLAIRPCMSRCSQLAKKVNLAHK